MSLVSIICPTYNEERFIESCVQSILNQDLPASQWELLIVDGMSTDKTREVVQPFLDKHANIRLLDNPNRTAPYAMNIGIRNAKGDYICRIDAHSLFPVNYVSTLLHYIQTLPDAANVGCVCDTRPANDSLKARAIAIACSHPLGVGNSTFRTAVVDKPIEADTVPFGFWHKQLFDQVGLFDEEMTRNQDDEFNARTIQSGGKIYLVPGISITYFVRDSIAKTCKMFYQYGLFKPLGNKKINHPATVRQFVPVAFVLGLVLGLPLAIINSVFCWIYIGCIAFYVLLLLSVSIKYKNPYLPVIFNSMHISYGVGYIRGIIKLLLHRPFNVINNR